MEQILPKKDPDGIVRKRDVYTGPKGSGYVDYEYRMNEGKLEMRGTHVGPESKNVPTEWTEIPDRIEVNRKITGVENRVVDEVLEVFDPADPEPDLEIRRRIKITERKTVEVPVYSDVQEVIKHPYKETYYK